MSFVRLIPENAGKSDVNALLPLFWFKFICVFRPRVVTVSVGAVAIVHIFSKLSARYVCQFCDNSVFNLYFIDLKLSLAHFNLIVIVIRNVIFSNSSY